MRHALGLDVDAAPIFAASVALAPTDEPSDAVGGLARPEPLAGSVAPSPERVASIVDATVAAIAAATVLDGEQPAVVAVVHPLDWDVDRVERLRRALTRAELREVLVVGAPVVAAVTADPHDEFPGGQQLAVVALRPGGAEVQGLRKVGPHSYRESGAPVPVDGVPERELDDALLRLVDAQVVGGIALDSDDPILEGALLKLRVAARLAREQLCTGDSAIVGVRMPGQAALIQVQRGDFQDAVETAVRRELPALVAAIRTASGGRTPAAVLLTGTAAPTPLLAGLLTEVLSVPVRIADGRDRGAIGAALFAGAIARAAERDAVAWGVENWDVENWSIEQTGQIELPLGAVEALPVAFLDRPAASGAAGAGRSRGKRRDSRPLTLLSLWPITVAAAVLVAFAGTAASGALDVVPAGDHPTSGVTDRARPDVADPVTTPRATPSATPSVVPAPAPTSDAGAGTATTPPKKKGTTPTTAPVPVVPVVPPVPPTPTPTPTPTSTPTPTPPPTPDPTPTP